MSADNPESKGEATNSAHIPGSRGNHLETSGHQNLGVVRDRILLVSTNACSGKPVPGTLTHLIAEGRPSIPLGALKTQEPRRSLRQDLSGF